MHVYGVYFSPGCSVLLNHRVHAVVGVLSDDTDPMVTVMKLEKAPQETYADIGGLDQQIQVSLRGFLQRPNSALFSYHLMPRLGFFTTTLCRGRDSNSRQ